MNSKIWLSSPHMSGNEVSFVKEAFDTNWIAPLGPHVNSFEHDLEAYTGIGYAAALSSGTAALHLALIMLGVKPGDEVICQSFTFSASANPIVYLGATPVFVDSETETWNMCPELLEEAIIDRISKGKKPKAIIPVHLYGMPAQIDAIIAIAAKYDIPVIEDAAEALGSTFNDVPVGTFGDMAVLSFNGNKIITTSGGGALLSNNENFILQARFLSTQARDPGAHYEHSQIGYNYRMSNVCAAIGHGQMMVLEERVAQRRNVYDYYYKNFVDLPGLSFLNEPKGYKSNRWLTTILLNPAISSVTSEILRYALAEENIESRPLWKPMHLQPVFKNCPAYTNGVSENLFNNGLCLPSGSNLTDEEIERVLNVIKESFFIRQLDNNKIKEMVK